MIQELTIFGYRGFETSQTLKLAVPNGKLGSGLAVVVGPNGGGKSTVFESFRKLTQPIDVSFTTGKRNKRAGDRVEITLRWDGGAYTMESLAVGSSETRRTGDRALPKVHPLGSRRVFDPYFNRDKVTRENYLINAGDPVTRTASGNHFSSRLFAVLDNYSEFSEIFDRVYGQKLEWTVYQHDDGKHFVKVTRSDGRSNGVKPNLLIST